jgi:sulfite reductase (ferredoxin)
LAIGAVPSKRIPEVVDRMTGRYLAERSQGETFHAFIKRIGKAECKKAIEDLTVVPPHDADPNFYQDWGDAREFTVGDLGVGECAGEVVSPIEFELTACEREAFEAQLQLEKGDVQKAAEMAYAAMHHAALALLKFRGAGFPEDTDSVAARFRTLFYDTQLFWDPFTGGKFAHYYFQAHERAGEVYTEEFAHQLIEEAQLFIEASHSCYAKMLAEPAVAHV